MPVNWSHFLEEQSRLSAKLNAFHPVTGERLFPKANYFRFVNLKEQPWMVPYTKKDKEISKGAIGLIQVLEDDYTYYGDRDFIYIWANGDMSNCPDQYTAIFKDWTRLVLDLHDEKRTARRVQGRVKRFKEELMMEMWRPERVERLLESGDLEAVI